MNSNSPNLSCSGRRSDRVIEPSAVPRVDHVSGSPSAPESLTPVRSETKPQAHPERRRQRTVAGKSRAVSRRVDQAGLERLNRELSDRDHAVLHSIAAYKFLSTRQLQLLHFHDHATPTSASRICRRVLLRLRELGVIEELDRRLGGVRAGSDSYVWRVGRTGDRLLQMADGHGARARRKEPSLHYLQHCLAIADTYLTLLVAHRARLLELVRSDTEPATWRSYLGPGGERLTLKPDLYTVTASGEYEDAWAIEQDLGTESIPTLLGKCRQYEAYRRTGLEQQQAGIFPLVVWIVPSQRRAERLTEAIDGARSLDRSLYRICTPDGLLDLILTGGAA